MLKLISLIYKQKEYIFNKSFLGDKSYSVY